MYISTNVDIISGRRCAVNDIRNGPTYSVCWMWTGVLILSSDAETTIDESETRRILICAS